MLALLWIHVLNVLHIFCCRSMAPSNVPQMSSFALRSILEKDKLNGTNFTNWYRNLRIVLKQEKRDHVLDNPLPDEPDENATTLLRMPTVGLVMSPRKLAVLCLLTWNRTCSSSSRMLRPTI